MAVWQCLILNILLSVQICFSLERDFQLLQQNSYFNFRYFENYSFRTDRYRFILKTADLIAKLILLAKANFYICAVYFLISAVICFFYERSIQARSVKKLVFTARIKRMYACAAIILSIIVLINFAFLNSIATAFALSFGAILSVLICPLINIINIPVEASFRRYYIKDAEKILEQRKDMLTVGITGSFGKTSTKHILNRILSEKYNVYMTPGGINTPLGIVRCVRENMPNDTQIFICEMGAKKTGDIKEICDIVHPGAGIVTTVGAMHLNTFKSIENIKKTKLELADSVIEKNGKVFLNGDNEYLSSEKEKYSAITFGIGENSDYRAKDIQYGRDGASFTAVLKSGEEIKLKTKLLGVNNVINILSSVSVAAELGVSVNDIKYAVSQLKPVSHRLELKSFINGSVLIDDAYNANPVGSREAINVLSSFDGMKKICVTPGLIELGKSEYEENKHLGEYMAERCDKIILVGEQRSIPLSEGIKSVKPDADVTVVKSFADALNILRGVCDGNTVVIFENDLPDNYLK